ncbi:uncharacterized protein (DUF885 family) [Zymomonas mobilis]|uniref:DUF885 domain-containing protein n=1 Tax=Zymomonas mobilis TaxID=542 RepID=UPI00026D8A4F|nr:DUF885 family protein [Zymomonas mobilis]AFN56290.1 protein of unknown function DUF885 [Zymomonas mobilis subsp. mobilis ATCC 29191]TQK78280.1 uncharacterized protein (DUF885 family) [Zymomonas mobilis]TQL15073.1 uncharacterized protein (DUF885 family) [Zymomonas mobilis]GEB87601.1 Tat pathway signal protein [Zymomonas mobilis subsp. mobilis]
MGNQQIGKPDSQERRNILKKTATVLTVAGISNLIPKMASAENNSPLSELLAEFAHEILVLSPEMATSLGFDKGQLAGLEAKLSDNSEKGLSEWSRQIRSMRQRLDKVKASLKNEKDQIQYETVSYAVDRGLDGLGFSYGGGAAAGFSGGTETYSLSQQNGVTTSMADFLNSQHRIENKADVEAYLLRLQAFSRQIKEETEELKREASIGVIPPNFIAQKAFAQMQDFRAIKAEEQSFVQNLDIRAKKAGIQGSFSDKAARIVKESLYPALDIELAEFSKIIPQAGNNPSVSRLPDGEAYYHWALRLGTTLTTSASDIHKIGLEQNEILKAEMDGLLKSQGFTQGSVGQRLQALSKDQRFIYPDNDAGRAEILDYLNGRLAAIRPLLPKLSHLGMKAPILVKRVPPDVEKGAPLGYMNFPALDGSRPAIYYINLASTNLWQRYSLTTLTAHEGIPGHSWQGAYLAEHHSEIPLISSMMGFNAFVEGWALYAEKLVDELGLYTNDPVGRIGYLLDQQFRACRLVIDTGLHSMGWSRDQAIRYLIDECGYVVDAATSEVDRYCASPGQACGYKMGQLEILRLRQKAKDQLGLAFDLASFDDAIVRTGGVPLPVLGDVINRYITRNKG